jgi:hypothetical protein
MNDLALNRCCLRALLFHRLVLLDTTIPIAGISRDEPVARRTYVRFIWLASRANVCRNGLATEGNALSFFAHVVEVTVMAQLGSWKK